MMRFCARQCTALVAVWSLAAVSLGGCPGPRPVAERPTARVNPVEGLAAQLRDRAWQKRAEAAQKLGATRHADAVAPLAGAVGDSDKRVRLAVVQACGAHGSPTLIPALKKGSEDKDRGVRRHAVRGLARIGTREAAEAMIDALDGASMWLRPEVADGLAAMPVKALEGLEVAVQILVAELDPNQKARLRRLAKPLEAIGEPALRILVLAVYKPAGPLAKKSVPTDINCKRGPCLVLVAMGPKVFRTLLVMTKDGIRGINAWNLYRRILPAIAVRLGKAVIPDVMRYLGQPGSRAYLAENTLAKMGSAAVPLLMKAVKKRGQSSKVLAAAVRLLGRIRDKRGTSVLLEALTASGRTVAYAVIRALARNLTEKTFVALSIRLKKGTKAERLVIIEAARKATGSYATRLILGALSWGPEEVLLAAVRALGERGDKQAVPVLLVVLKHRRPTAKLRLAVVRALGLLKDPTAFKVLAGLARRGKKTLRLAAIRGLGELGTKPAKKLLKRLKKSRNKEIAKAAADALNPASLSKFGLGKTGVPECDKYLSVAACYISKMPGAARGPTIAAFRRTIQAWKKMATGPARSSVAKGCQMAMSAWRKAVSKMPLYKACFKP